MIRKPDWSTDAVHSVLETTGMILEAGRWAILEALKEYEEWSKQGLMPPTDRRQRFAHSTQAEGFWTSCVTRSGHTDERPGLDLEITESLIMEDIKGNIEKLRAIRTSG